MTATQTRPAPHTTDPQPIPTANGRDTGGRFAKGNPGGPGNPFYRKQAEFRRAVLELFTPEDVMSLLRVMLALGRNGDVAAAKVFLEYVVGKPHKAPDPDREEHHDWQLSAEALRLAGVAEQPENSVPAHLASEVTRDAVPPLAANRLEGMFDTSNAAPPVEPAAGTPEEPAAAPPDGQRRREVLRLLTATLRAAVANGVNGQASEKHRQALDRLTGDNSGNRTVVTVDNGSGPTVATADNGGGTGWETGPAVPTGPVGTRVQ